jgi:hypothetical protein
MHGAIEPKVSAVPSDCSVAKNVFDWLKNALEETFIRWLEGSGRELDVESMLSKWESIAMEIQVGMCRDDEDGEGTRTSL